MPSLETGWWEVERARLVRERTAALTRPGELLADVGCGRGEMLAHRELVDRVVVNVDSHRWESWTHRPGVHYVVAAADALPFRDHAFDLVGSFDVLEHLADDELALREQVRIATKGGWVVATVPAGPRLWSAHDVAVGHHRRYGRHSLEDLARRCGLTVMRATCFFSFLWVPALLTRNRASRRSEPGTGEGIVSRVIRRVVESLCATERWLLRRWRLPVGTSIWMETIPSRDPRPRHP
jgi:SAM-dependent methyltransferase